MESPFVIESRHLSWVFPDEENGSFVLRGADGEAAGWLRYADGAGARSLAEVAGRRWALEHTGGTHPSVSIRAAEPACVMAEYHPSITGGGEVRFASGAHYSWCRHALWSDRWCFCRKGECDAVCVSQDAGPLTSGARVMVCCEAAKLEETPILILLGWYLRVLAFEKLTERIPELG